MTVTKVAKEFPFPLVDGRLNHKQIQKVMPQGSKAIFVDRVWVDEGKIMGYYLFDKKRCDMFPDHFPGKPILMGALEQEIIQQTALAGLAMDYRIKYARALGTDYARYYKEVADGQKLLTIIDRIEEYPSIKQAYLICGTIYFADKMGHGLTSKIHLESVCVANLIATVIACPRQKKKSAK